MTKTEALAQYRESLYMLRKQILQVETNLTRLEVAIGNGDDSPSPTRHLLRDIKICTRALEGYFEMMNTKALARKILSGLSDPVVNNEVWLRDVLDDAYDSLLRENYKLKRDVLSLEREVSELRLELSTGVRE